MTNALEIALRISNELGLPVFPCREKPNATGKGIKSPYTANGYTDASTDEQQIRNWWHANPNALIGVPTGQASGILVVDIDQSDVKDGEASFAELGIGDPETVQTITQSGGRHIIFKYPDGYDIRNSAGNVLGKSIDVRANGGYVIWAGSRTENGNYDYRNGYEPNKIGFKPLPDTLLTMLTAPSEKSKLTPLLGENIPEGQRNHTLFREGVTLANAGVSDAEVVAHIERRSAACDSPLPRSEIIGIQKSALSYKETAVIPFTDLGNGERLVRDWDGQILYCSDQRAWYAWANTHWEMDEQRVKQCAKRTTRDMRAEPIPSAEMLKAQIAWQKTSESTARQASMLEAASSDEKITRKFDVFCRDERLFNLQNGTFDLDKLTLREHRRGDHITKIANASLTEDATCPRWIQFVDEITDGDERLALFLQKFCGYMLSGDRSEQIILFLLGEGANGKSVFLDVLKYVFGTYAGVINAKALIDRSASSIPSDIAALANKRFVMMSEFPEHAPLNTATVKSITGGDEITARHLYREWFEFKPQFQVVCALNDLPKLTWIDEAYFRRVRIVPFNRFFEPNERDKNLHATLKAEADGIMRWLVEGYQLYGKEGLEPSAKMRALSEAYRVNEDPVTQFVDTCLSNSTETDFVPFQEMVDAVRDYCHRQALDNPGERQVRKRLRELLGEPVQKRVGRHNARTRGFVGYIIIEDRDDDRPF
jgi:putative DNA primase/helicase